MSALSVARTAVAAVGPGEVRGRISAKEAEAIVAEAEAEGVTAGELAFVQDLYESGMAQMRAGDASPQGYDLSSNAQGVFLAFFERQQAGAADPVLGAQ